MKKVHKQCMKRAAAAALVMLTVSGMMPMQPIAEFFDTAVKASAETNQYTENGCTYTFMKLPERWFL